jgi:acetyl-CoA synthetase (ADP-forming)
MFARDMSYTLSEFESKQVLAEAGVPVPRERLVSDPLAAAEAAEAIGYPAVMKLCGRGIAHKTERKLVRLEITGFELAEEAAEELLARRGPGEEEAQVLVSPMIQGQREVIAGLVRDPRFGPCVMFGLGGIFAEALEDVAFAVAPLGPFDASDMIDALQHSSVLGAFRGEPPVDRERLGSILEALGRIGLDRPEILSIDINPLILVSGEPVVVDALVEVDDGS